MSRCGPGRREERSAGPPGPDSWVLSFKGFDPAREGTREALLTVGNGFMAVRGAMTHVRPDGIHYPAAYAAGVYNRLTSVVEGRSREDESMVNIPNWSALTYRFDDGEWFDNGMGDLEDHQVDLDLRHPVLVRQAVLVDGAGRRTRLRESRLVSMAAMHLAAVEVRLQPLNWSGRLGVRSAVDARVTNDNVPAYRLLSARHLEVTRVVHDGAITALVAETVQSRIRVAVAARTVLRSGRPADAPAGHRMETAGLVGLEFALDVACGEEVVVEKAVGVVTSRDAAISEPLADAVQTVRDAPGFARVLSSHAQAWDGLWRRFGIDVGGDGAAAEESLAVRVHLVHLLQTLSQHSTVLDVGVPARGLHGEAYRGHVFWDELFVFPLLNLRLPELTRSLLLYRWRRLPQARRRAAELGCHGALFPWQSGSDGREETPAELFNPRSGRWMPDRSRRQYHVNAAVAYNVWQHWQVTGDLGFLVRHGAELLVESARFFACLAARDPLTGRHDLRGVMGPDEFHDGYPDRPGGGVDNNAYLNVMASWALQRAAEVYHMIGPVLGRGLWDRLALGDEEMDLWDGIGRTLRVPFLGNGLMAQFEGYDDLEELDWDRYRRRYGDIGRLDLILEAEGDSVNRYKVSKQADTLMLFYLFPAEELTALLNRMGYGFDPQSIPATVDYYLARTSHGSTLSRVAHSWVLARTDRSRSWRLLRQALTADLSDDGGTTDRGIHLGAMAGTIDLLERCYTGLDTYGDALRFNPLLPEELSHLSLVLRYRDHILEVHVDHEQLRVTSAPGPARPITVAVGRQIGVVHPGESARFRLAPPHPAGPPRPDRGENRPAGAVGQQDLGL